MSVHSHVEESQVTGLNIAKPTLKHVLVLLVVLTAELTPQSVNTTDVLAQMHKRLNSFEQRTYNVPIVFTGEIISLGPVYQGPCKEGVSQEADFAVSRMLFGNHPGPIVRTGYINCTRRPLPSPPFTPHAKVIVYCERQHHHMSCLPPVELTDNNLRQIESWIAARQNHPR